MFRPMIGLSAVVLLSACSEPPRRAPRTARRGEPTVKVMTYNVNFGLAGDAAVIGAIRGGAADVVFLQETTADWEVHLRAAFAGRYPHMAFRHSGGAGGLAVLSRFPFEDRGTIPAPSGWFPAWRVEVASPLGPLQVLVVHLQPPLAGDGSAIGNYLSSRAVRAGEIEAFWKHVEPDRPTLVVGDFNEDEDGRAVGYLAARGLRSALPEFAPAQRTWRWTTSVGTVRDRLDHIVYDPRLLPLDVRALDAGTSDHLPVVGTFARSP